MYINQFNVNLFDMLKLNSRTNSSEARLQTDAVMSVTKQKSIF